MTQTGRDLPPFGRELRRWRSLRRVSQLELAHLSGTTQRHLSFMEQGRSRPGRSIVVRLAESLQLTLRERNALLLSAGYAPAFDESSLDGPALEPVRAAVEQVIAGHLPYPALAFLRPGRVVAANRAVAILLEGVDPELLGPGFNVFRAMLHPRGMSSSVANPGQWGRHVVDNFRALALRSPDPRLAALIAELEGYLPDYVPGPDHVGFGVPLRLRRPEGELKLFTTLTSFATATDVTLSDLVLEAFLPADAETAEILRARDADRAARGEGTVRALDR